MVSILLGAGASIEAGLPTAVGLTKQIIDGVGWKYRGFLEFVRLSMAAQRAAGSGVHGGSDGEVGIDSESLFNTVNDLVNRESLEIGPFVLNWHPLLAEIAARDARQELVSAIEGVRDIAWGVRSAADNMADAIMKAIRGSMVTGRILEEMQRAAIGNLQATKDLDYLSPICEFARRAKSPLVVGTLNYDLCVEEVCEKKEVTWSDGIGHADQLLDYTDCCAKVVKLHGSVSWQWVPDHQQGEKIQRVDPLAHRGKRSAILFGGRNKLTAEWPFFDLLLAWRDELNKCRTLWVVGYSFRDSHINSVIVRWLRAHDHRRLVIVDPNFDSSYKHPMSTYFDGASNESTSHYVDNGIGGRSAQRVPGRPRRPRVVILREGAGVALARLISENPHNPSIPTKLGENPIEPLGA